MSAESFKRKLTAILSADVKGYSRLMGEDEAATVKTLTSYRKIMGELIQQHRGRVIDSPGDNILAEFASVVDAVQCAVAAQNEFKARNAELPENRRMVFRIGVNLGDVIEEENRIYGDGVNIAARLEALADPGGICISKTAFDQIETKLPLGYEYLGDQTVKNIAKPVGAYKVLMEPRVTGAKVKGEPKAVPIWRRKALITGAVAVLIMIICVAVWSLYWRAPRIEPASKEKMAYPLPDKPSIAVLPFDNMSGDPKQDFFSDGITEEIITALSKSPHLFVIARNSTFTYKIKPVRVKQVAEDLGVRYVLEGSVRREGERVRITAQLIDALKGQHLWAERYDREAKEIFALQDEITVKVMTALHIKLQAGDHVQVLGSGTKNLDAFLKAMEAREHMYRFTKEDNAMARKLYEEVITVDPNYALGYAGMGGTYINDIWFGTSKSPKESRERAIELGQKAIALDDSNGMAHAGLSYFYAMARQYDKAIVHADKAVTLDPNSSGVLFNAASALVFSGRVDEAIPLQQKAIRLNPFAPGQYFNLLSVAYRMLGRYDAAVEQARKAVERDSKNQFGYSNLAAACILIGHEEEARAAAAELLKINPKFSLEQWAKALPYKDQSQVERTIESLRKAGLPDKPPLPLPDKPSIAVLPFVNMSDDPQQEYFSDGMTEDLITDLSKISGLFVIARNSTFVYKGKPVNVQQIGQDLKVRYLLEGSVRKAGDQVRINAQLLDASNGQHLWAERYDGRMGDIFTLQGGITRKIVSALALKLTVSEQKALADKGTDNPLAYEEYLKGWENYRQHTNESFARAKIYLEKAVELDPEFARAYAALAVLYFKAVQTPGLKQGLGLTDERKVMQASLKSRFLLEKAMKKPTALAHGMMSQNYLNMFLHNEAFAEIERAIAMDPNNPELHEWMSNILWLTGKDREAVESAKTAIRLDPNNPAQYFIRLARAYLPDGDLQESLTLLERARTLNPELSGVVGATQSIIYGLQSRDQEARAAYEVFAKSRVVPPRNLEELMAYYPFSDLKKSDRIAEAFVKAGAPGKPSDYCKVSRENLLKGSEIKNLLFGHKVTGTSPLTGEQFWYEWNRDGELNVIRGELRDKGKSWIEGDVIFMQLEKMTGGLFWNSTTFRNPAGTKEQKNQYMWVSDSRNITYFSPAD
jgi:adenylate cyclase